jgi:hypothetical protein
VGIAPAAARGNARGQARAYQKTASVDVSHARSPVTGLALVARTALLMTAHAFRHGE